MEQELHQFVGCVICRWKAYYLAYQEKLPNGLYEAILGHFEAIKVKKGPFFIKMAYSKAHNFIKSAEQVHHKKLDTQLDPIGP